MLLLPLPSSMAGLCVYLVRFPLAQQAGKRAFIFEVDQRVQIAFFAIVAT